MACCHFVLRMGILYWKSEVFSIFSFLFHLLITEKDGTVLNISAADKFTICRPEMRLSMDYNQNQNNEMNQNIPQIDPKYRGLSIASMVCGICSLVLCCTGLLSIPAGALGILFALLTRKRGQRMNNMCVAGIWLSCVGLALGIFITVSSIVTGLYEYAGSDVPADVRCRYGRILAILPVRHAYVFRCILQLRNQNPEQPE